MQFRLFSFLKFAVKNFDALKALDYTVSEQLFFEINIYVILADRPSPF